MTEKYCIEIKYKKHYNEPDWNEPDYKESACKESAREKTLKYVAHRSKKRCNEPRCGTFPICFTHIKPIFNLNRCYEKKINSCIDYYKSNNKLKPKSNGFFYLLFIYSIINYHDAEEKNISDILLNNK